MKQFLFAAALAVLGSGATAATIDFTDESFVPGSLTYASAGPINGFQEAVDGVTFTFATSGQFRNIGPWLSIIDPAFPALTFGGGSGNASVFTISASADVMLDAFLGFAQQFNTGAIFDVTGAGVTSTGNSFSTDGFLGSGTPVATNFVGGPLSLQAGAVYTFTTTNFGSVTQSHMTGLEFTKTQGVGATIPLPAGLPLLLSGLAGLAALRWRRYRN